MLQRDQPSDYVIGTGTSNTVDHLVRIAFDQVELNPDCYARVASA